MSDSSADVRLDQQLISHLESLYASGVSRLPPSLDELTIEFVPTSAVEEIDPNTLRAKELAVLAERVSQCTRCGELASTRTQTVFGVGPIDAEICFVGEAPGADEDRLGEPFVGEAGKLLNKIIQACGLSREDIFICNVLRCRPPGNRTPNKTEANNCWEYLENTLRLVQPKFIVCWGLSAAQTVLKVSSPLGSLRNRMHEYDGIPVLVTYHPASLLPHRSPENKKLVWEDMQKMLRYLGKPIPETRKG
ncbi:MAG: uracil-DNA glycosylase [Zavarzinella sp.]